MTVSRDSSPTVWTDVINVKLDMQSGSTAGDTTYKVLPGGKWRVVGYAGTLQSATDVNDKIFLGKYDVDTDTFYQGIRILSGNCPALSTAPWFASPAPVMTLVVSSSALQFVAGEAIAISCVAASTLMSGTVEIQLCQE